MALAIYLQRLTPPADAPPAPMSAAESPAWLASLESLRAGFPRFSAYGRASALDAASRLLGRYAVVPSPADWPTALGPAFDLFAAALSDQDAGVRATAVRAIGGFWGWMPGRDLFTAEVKHLADWKEGLYQLAVRALADPDATVRVMAVAALAALPLPDQAAPAVAAVRDEHPDVRYQVLAGFRDRRELLDEEAILPLLFDPVPRVAQMAETVLKHRGLTPDQIGLGKMVVHPLPKMRASAITLLRERSDIDPTVWLVYLSRDSDDEVRAEAVAALAENPTLEARERLAEIAATDASPTIREAAARAGQPSDRGTIETTALPPLPGSTSLNPRAN
jgi:HEAT repeat protein